MTPAAPILILLPGLDGSGGLFDAFEREIPEGWERRIVRYAPNIAAVHDAYVEHALAQLPEQGRMLLIAESFSGSVAAKLAHRLGDRVAGLVLCASFVTPPHRLLSLLRFVPVKGVELGIRLTPLLRRYCLDTRTDPAVLEKLSITLRSLDSALVLKRLRLLEALDVTAPWRELQVPILLMQATHDRLVTRLAQSALERSANPRKNVVYIDGPHFLLQARPAHCWHAIASWWYRLSLPGTTEAI